MGAISARRLQYQLCATKQAPLLRLLLFGFHFTATIGTVAPQASGFGVIPRPITFLNVLVAAQTSP